MVFISTPICVHGHQLQQAREAAARMVSVRVAKRGALIIAASSRQGGASAPSPRVRDDSGSKQCFFSVPHSRRYDFELLCETSEPEGDGQFKVPAALKLLPALDPNPILSSNPPLLLWSGAFIKDYTSVPSRFS